MTITDFLSARIAEDEYDANRELSWGTTQTLTRMNARVLAECAAKRAIVAMAPDDDGYVKIGDWESCSDSCPPLVAEAAIRALAAVYADHPDYLQEWAL
ncbi:DUF6221 family protein [Pseudarthrobacter sp. S9]|uniref:DUF6221 family protein n=1 Tax=Pseudarthrobacter sp. S9 TaxID=3418421 RepID=UPI003CFFCFB3